MHEEDKMEFKTKGTGKEVEEEGHGFGETQKVNGGGGQINNLSTRATRKKC